MSKEKEPEQLASIALSKEEIASRQRTSHNLRPVKDNRVVEGPKVLWALTIFALILAVLLLVQLQQVKKQSGLQLQALTILQEKLTNTGEQSNLSVDAIKILLKDQDHEIRKLWDVANKRNKNAIAKNKGRLDRQGKLISQQGGKLDSVNKEISRQVGVRADKLAKRHEQLALTVKTLKNDGDKRIKQWAKKIDSLPKNIKKTLVDHGKGIKAMDATRLQLMKRIKSLEKQIKALKKSVASSPKVL